MMPNNEQPLTPQQRGARTRARNRRYAHTQPTQQNGSAAVYQALFGIVASGKKGPGGTVTIPAQTFDAVKEALKAVLA